MSTRTRRAVGASVALGFVGLILLLALSTGSESESTAGRQTDGAFLTSMVPHHEDAIEMATLARRRANRSEIKTLASEIIDAQTGETQEMGLAHQRIFGEPLPEGGMMHGDLGLSEAEMGMPMDMRELESAREFDRSFIDAMIRHHQAAIRMARVEIERGSDAGVKRLAAAIVAAQSREIEQMNSWRRSWYGAASPSGGIPG